MKKYKFLILITCLFIANAALAQNMKRFTVSYKNTPLHIVLKDIMKITGMGYSLNTECLNQAPLISIKATNASLDYILKMICKGSPITYYITDNIVILAPRPVRGLVTNEMGEPIADVIVQAGDNTALTNSKGEFYLRYAACEKTIKFSYPGDTVVLRHPGTYVTVRMRNLNTITAN